MYVIIEYSSSACHELREYICIQIAEKLAVRMKEIPMSVTEYQ